MNKAEEVQEYLKVEESFFDSLSQKLGDALSLYCVTGSLARKEIIPNWSDIDVLLSVEELSLDVFEDIRDVLNENDSGIHIGLSLFSNSEISNRCPKLGRTLLAVNEILEGTLTPRVKKNSIYLMQTEEVVIRNINRIEYARALHDYKRSIITNNATSESKIYKLLILLLKIQLMERGITTKSYDDVLRRTGSLNIPFTIPHPREIIDTPNLFLQRKACYINLIQNLDDLTFYSF